MRHFSSGLLLTVGWGLVALFLPPSLARAQTAPPAQPPVKSVVSVRTSSRSANIKTGEIVALDAETETLTLKDRTGKSTLYVLTEKTRCLKAHRMVQTADFKVGETVTLRLRKSRSGGPPLIVELSDPATALWLRGLRSKTVSGPIKEISEESLTLAVGPDELNYTLSEKTRWSRGGKEIPASEFKAGDRVFVVPRALPSGALMARAVSDTENGAAQLKERTARSVKGVLQNLDAGAHKLTLATVAGDLRTLPYTDETEVRMSGKTLPLSVLKVGQHIGLSLKKDEEGEQFITRITLTTTKRAPRRAAPGAANAAGNKKP